MGGKQAGQRNSEASRWLLTSPMLRLNCDSFNIDWAMRNGTEDRRAYSPTCFQNVGGRCPCQSVHRSLVPINMSDPLASRAARRLRLIAKRTRHAGTTAAGRRSDDCCPMAGRDDPHRPSGCRRGSRKSLVARRDQAPLIFGPDFQILVFDRRLKCTLLIRRIHQADKRRRGSR